MGIPREIHYRSASLASSTGGLGPAHPLGRIRGRCPMITPGRALGENRVGSSAILPISGASRMLKRPGVSF